jgi:hypothetical protein
VSASASGDGIFGIVQALVGSASDGAGRVISAEAAVSVASTFGFPIALAMLVLLFLAVQPRLDKRDPKLSSTPRTLADTLVAFEDDAR